MRARSLLGYLLVAVVVGVVVGGALSSYYAAQLSSYRAKYAQLLQAEAAESRYEDLAEQLLSRLNISYSPGLNLTQVLETPRVGIVTPMAMEEAPVLAAMHVQGVINISGYEFFVGTIGDTPVVLVRSGEQEYSVTMATLIMDTFFKIEAAILSGTAGSRNPNITVGDVVLGAFVVDKSAIHYHRGYANFTFSETPYPIEVVNLSPLLGAGFAGFGEAQVTPVNASSYGYGYGEDMYYTYVTYLPASLGLLQLAEQYRLPPTPLSYITGENVSGSAPSYVIAGVIGSANQWTEPLQWLEEQNALYETDAGENEGFGFALVNAHFGIPWLIVRGISDSPWYPSVYEGVYAAEAAANVTIYVVEHFSPSLPNLHTPCNFSDLSPMSNARAHGYIVADRVYYEGLQPVMVVYTAQNGSEVTYWVGSSWQLEYSYNYTPPNLRGASTS